MQDTTVSPAGVGILTDSSSDSSSDSNTSDSESENEKPKKPLNGEYTSFDLTSNFFS